MRRKESLEKEVDILGCAKKAWPDAARQIWADFEKVDKTILPARCMPLIAYITRTKYMARSIDALPNTCWRGHVWIALTAAHYARGRLFEEKAFGG